ncbi:ATP-binding protein [Aetokthonos hydrillicola Thurmond2011]|uniref:histidine kinase n=2 Tax=Aetokthonos TaxID=1550243 RepID=A0AAP5I742_9CYAN|nr:ATP-binding protein [Aetokthonos hydrillicola]MDR9896066.1 ATP-binding protein [Aetokthonos hydrillicola Thurmond2011]
MGARMREIDWSQTSLGSAQHWSQSLKTAVRIMLTSRQPMFVWWGDELINLYNDAYKSIVGGKHPKALGQPASVVWREIWDQVGPRAESAMLNNEGTYDEALLLIMERNGYPEETYYTFSYSPVPNDEGGTGGIICANSEDTQRIISERQLSLLRELASRTADARTFDEACTLSASCLKTNPYDLPFAMIYLVDPDKQIIFLAGTCGIMPNHVAVPEAVAIDSDSVWQFAQVLKTNKPQLISNLGSSFDNLPTGAWNQPPHQAVAVPIAPSGETGRSGILVTGLNPFRLFDKDYSRFIDLVAAQISASIANAQAYEQERKRAEALAEIDRAKTVFFNNVSHEFRTPLTLMLGPLEETLTNCATLLPPQEREQLQMVQRNGLRLLKLVNTLLDFSRIEAGRIQASYEPIDLATFTAELASVFRSAIERAEMRLVVNCPRLPSPVYVDREMWEKIVLNLLSNAFKFTFEGEIAVSLLWANDHVNLVVRDTGIGIPAEEIPHLFERFHRVKGAQGRTFEGSGIGLSLVQELVQMHGGTVEVTSVLGKGSCFIVSIPTGSAHLPADRIHAERTLASTALSTTPYLEEALRWLPEGSGEALEALEAGGEDIYEYALGVYPSLGSPVSQAYILLADDNADMRDYVKRLLSPQYEVEAVPDGLTALSFIGNRVPDLVLTDVMMPGLDGFGLLHSLRSDQKTREVPIILLSARAGEEARVEGLEAGADDYLTKPFSARELSARVEATLKLSRLRQESAKREQELRAISEAARNEAEEARRQVTNILESITDDFVAFDTEWRYTYVNKEAAKFLRRTQEVLLGSVVWEIFPELVGSTFEEELRRSLSEQITVEFEEHYQRFNTWIEVHAYPSVTGLAVYFRDITDRKRAEEALRESEQRFRNMADNAPVMIWVTNAAGYCTYLSQSWYNFTGQTEETGLGFGWLDAVHPEDYEYAKNTFLDANKNCKAFRAEYRLRRKDGTYAWAIDAASPRFEGNGQFKGYIGSVIDITERKTAEAERDRLLELEQAARAEAERANRVKDEFLAVLSHELRSPLNPIVGWARLLQTREFEPGALKHALATIERNAKLQAQLIEDLLDVSRILQGKLSLKMAPVSLVSVIEAAIETVRLAAEAKDIQIQTMLDASVAKVLGDSGRLQQVVWNLLSNAVKFTPEGGKVNISLNSIDSQPQITVSDTGKGINPKFLPHVFEYFRQADSTTTRESGGLGLGLAIVRHLVELHGGTIWAESPGEGSGATFSLRLPIIKKEVSTTNNTTFSALDPCNTTLILTDIQVLVVDDDVDTRDFYTFVLQEFGARVTAVGSGKEALQALTQSDPDILVSDIGMPEMDGYMFMHKVKEQGKQIPAIALTAYAGELDQQKALLAGFQKHLSKPIEPDDLINAIVNLMGRNGIVHP